MPLSFYFDFLGMKYPNSIILILALVSYLIDQDINADPRKLVLLTMQLVLDAETVRMPSLPLSKGGVSGSTQDLFEVCVCHSGKLFLSKAARTSTCSENQDC